MYIQETGLKHVEIQQRTQTQDRVKPDRKYMFDKLKKNAKIH